MLSLNTRPWEKRVQPSTAPTIRSSLIKILPWILPLFVHPRDRQGRVVEAERVEVVEEGVEVRERMVQRRGPETMTIDQNCCSSLQVES